ncbi:MAG TPA: cupredoxin domain-containing protein [Rhizomicrobium sp.]|nr:cupredoxin domain-containing protein [Rhizomicrobium sp.]
MKKFLLPLLLIVPSLAFSDDGHTIIQKGRRFSAAEVTIRRGDALTFTNNDEFIHQIYSTDQFDSDERVPGQTLTETFEQAGTFEVHCHIHPKMKLVVHVN